MVLPDNEHGASESHADPTKEAAKERLLDAAERLFGSRGFDATSVRDLTAEAGCNVAAVNYHFGSKEQLYAAMLRRHIRGMIAQDLRAAEDVLSGPEPSLEELLLRLVGPTFRAAYRGEPPATAIRLMVREVLNQHVDEQVMTRDLKEVFLPRMAEALRSLVPGLDVRRSELLVFTLDAMMMHPLLFMPFYVGWVQGLDVEELIAHVVASTAAAMRAFSKVS